MKYKINQVGDTIIEVMLALMIMGTVIAGAYSLTNLSLNTENLAEQRSNALLLAQSQLERFKSIIGPGGPDNITYLVNSAILSEISTYHGPMPTPSNALANTPRNSFLNPPSSPELCLNQTGNPIFETGMSCEKVISGLSTKYLVNFYDPTNPSLLSSWLQTEVTVSWNNNSNVVYLFYMP